MKIEVHIDPELEQPKVVICAPARNGQVETLIRCIQEAEQRQAVTAFRDGEALLLPCSDVLRFFADGKGVCCQTVEGTYAVRQRLYELEENLAGTRFVRVSNSEIVNLDRVSALDLSLSGTIRMTLAGNVTVYASRRYVKKIKQVLGL